MASDLFLQSKPGSWGRKLSRRLDNQRVYFAIKNLVNFRLAMKFRPRWRTKLAALQNLSHETPA